MKTAKRYNRIRNLMIVSQIMLLGLVAQWLSSQFRQEHLVLEKELSDIYNSAEERVLDSLLFQFFISPALGDSTVRVTGFGRQPIQIRRADTSSKMVYSRIRSKGVLPEVSPGSVSIFMTDSVIDHIEVKREAQKVVNTDIALRGVRMIIHSERDTTGTAGGLWRSMSQNIDTALFINSIQEGLNEHGLKVTIGFAVGRDSLSSGPILHSELVLGDSFPGSFPPVRVSGIRMEVMRTILPQILFAILLLALTGTAFILAHRSLRSQLIVSRIKDEFISNISHELKTPVATVKLALETLSRHDLKDSSDTVRDYLRIASLETDRLDRLVSRVLDYGRMESVGTGFVMEKVSVPEVIARAAKTMEDRIATFGAELLIEADQDIYVRGDTFYLESVITNLIDNSVKYGGTRVHIIVSAVSADNRVIITVDDNGPGIPEEFISQVFDKFFRVPSDNLHNIKGYGLGLSFSQMVVNNHGGRISVRNLPEGGCSFTITLPEYGQNPLRRG
jgi:signal transduction histidine kinase